MRRRMQPGLWVLGLVPSLALLGAGDSQPAKPAAQAREAKEVPETKEVKDGIDLYFRDADIASLAKQELAVYPQTAAGESKLSPRSFPDAPPQISHTVEDMLPITASSNDCLECHDPSNATEAKDVPLPKSHFSRAQMAAGAEGQPMVWVVQGYEQAKDVAGTRYNCVMCHVPQASNARVLKSSFVATKPRAKKQ